MIEYCKEANIKNFTLIVPAVSVGNVGQLAVDLVIHSLCLKKLGYVWHESVVPIAGPNAFNFTDKISTGCEFFISEELQLVVMQIRSGILRTENDFSQFLCNWIKEQGISQVIILTGSSAHERRDEQLVGEPVRYIFSPLVSEVERNNAISRKWKEFEVKEMNSQNGVSSSEISYIPGSGITLKLFKTCIKEMISCAVLIEFCSDGDNAPDAYRLADYLDEWLRLRERCNCSAWVPPPSWNLLYGCLPPKEIFN